MQRGRPLRFLAIALVAFAILMAPWPGLERAYAVAFRTFGNVSFSVLGLDGKVDVERSRHDDPNKDTVLYVRRGVSRKGVTCGSRFVGWIPTCVVLALVAAAPLSWARRRRSLLFSLLLVHGYVFLRLVLVLLLGVNNQARAAGEPWPHWQSVTLVRVTDVLHLQPAIYVAVPFLLWGLATLRRSDLDAWNPRAEPEA